MINLKELTGISIESIINDKGGINNMSIDEIITLFIIRELGYKKYPEEMTDDVTITHLWTEVFSEEDKNYCITKIEIATRTKNYKNFT